VPSDAEEARRPIFRLFPATPSPFTQATDIRFSVALEGPVRVAIYDALGRRVALLLDQARPAGLHRLHWDGRNHSGRPVPSGVYWCRVQSGSRSETIRLVRLR
jgi:flagellar hook assembly protein FlgD